MNDNDNEQGDRLPNAPPASLERQGANHPMAVSDALEKTADETADAVTHSDEAEIERLLAELAPDDVERSALREAHRQLEKDLLRLADPLPPTHFLSSVMARVEAEPRRITGNEVRSAVAIALVGLLASGASFVLSGASPNGLALRLAQSFVGLRELIVGFGSALSVLWRTAGLPLSILLAAVVMLALVGLRRMVGAPLEAKVVS
jgi:hypothetical protein